MVASVKLQKSLCCPSLRCFCGSALSRLHFKTSSWWLPKQQTSNCSSCSETFLKYKALTPCFCLLGFFVFKLFPAPPHHFLSDICFKIKLCWSTGTVSGHSKTAFLFHFWVLLELPTRPLWIEDVFPQNMMNYSPAAFAVSFMCSVSQGRSAISLTPS